MIIHDLVNIILNHSIFIQFFKQIYFLKNAYRKIVCLHILSNILFPITIYLFNLIFFLFLLTEYSFRSLKKIKSRTSSDKEKQPKSPSSSNKSTNSSSPSTPTKVSPSVQPQLVRPSNPTTPVKSSNLHTGTAPTPSSSSSSSSSTKHHHPHIPNVLKHSSSILRLKSIKSNQSINSSSDHSHDNSSKARNTISTRRTSMSSVASINSTQISNGLNKSNVNSSPTNQKQTNVAPQPEIETPVKHNEQQEAVYQKQNSQDSQNPLKPLNAQVQPLQPTQPIQQQATSSSSSSSNKTTQILASHSSHHYPAVATHSNEKLSSEQKTSSTVNKTLQTSPSPTRSFNPISGTLSPKKVPSFLATQSAHSTSKLESENLTTKESKTTPIQTEATAPVAAAAAEISGTAENISSSPVNIPGNRDGVLLNPDFEVIDKVTDSAKRMASETENALVDSLDTSVNSDTNIKTAPEVSTKITSAVSANSSRPVSAVSASSSMTSNSNNKGSSSFTKMKNAMKSIKIGSRTSSPAPENPLKQLSPSLEELGSPEIKSTAAKLETEVEKFVEKVTETIVNIETFIVDGVNQALSPRVVSPVQDDQILDDADNLTVQHQPIKTGMKNIGGEFKESDEDKQNKNSYQSLISSIMNNIYELQKEFGNKIDSSASLVSSSLSSNADSLKKTIDSTSGTISSISKNTYTLIASKSSDCFAAASTSAKNNALITSDVAVAICTGGLLVALFPRSKQKLAIGTAITTSFVLINDIIFRFGYFSSDKA